MDISNSKKILITGIKPTGRPHIGNYFGMMRQAIEMQKKYRSFVFIPDLHALTNFYDAKNLASNAREAVIDYLALGLDPEEAVIFLQSDIPEIAELGWIFNCITTVPYLSRAHAYKDAQAKGSEVSVGTFDYPLLMAADILIQDAEVVPVGADQKQHIEIARDTAEKFNSLFGETFALPDALIVEEVKTVPGTDGRKMSKSYGNTISLFASDEEIRKAVMSIPTDSKGVDEPKDPERDNVFALHKLAAPSPAHLLEIEKRYKEGGLGYKESKELLAANLIAFIAPLREKRKEFAEREQRENLVRSILREGGKIARERAIKKLEEARKKAGVWNF